MYLKRMDYDPSDKKVEELRVLSDKIPEPVTDDLQYTYYEDRIAKLKRERFRILTGYGQCRGRLIAHNGDIVVCCCREMAELVAFRNAYHSEDRIHVPVSHSIASRYDNSFYLVTDSEEVLSECPFCCAPLQEKIDYTDDRKKGE